MGFAVLWLRADGLKVTVGWNVLLAEAAAAAVAAAVILQAHGTGLKVWAVHCFDDRETGHITCCNLCVAHGAGPPLRGATSSLLWKNLLYGTCSASRQSLSHQLSAPGMHTQFDHFKKFEGKTLNHFFLFQICSLKSKFDLISINKRYPFIFLLFPASFFAPTQLPFG